MGAVAYGVRQTVAGAAGSPLVTFAATTLAGMAVYPVALYALEWQFQFGLTDLVQRVKRGI
jgi:hypothetical protein